MEDALQARPLVVQSGVEASDGMVAEAAKTDPHAFGELYERYYARVYRYVYHRVGNAADAEDLTAVVFMKALEAMHSYRCTASGFAPWLFRITHNAVVDHYRRDRKHHTLDDLPHEAPTGDPVSNVLRTERQDELRSLLTHLSPDQRDVVLMRYAADLSFSEIAAALSKNEAAVRMLLHRGLRKMKAVMDDE
jgi:RNA polymerase sigma-70 factor (ECF subfamily)